MAKPKITSKVKLTNKSASKKMKMKGKSFISKYKSPVNRKIPQVGKRNASNNKDKEKIQLDYSRPVESEEELVESDFSDEEMKSFLQNNSQNMSFLASNLRYNFYIQ